MADDSPPVLSGADHAAMLRLRDALRHELRIGLDRYPPGTDDRAALIVEWMYEACNTLMPASAPMPGVFYDDVWADDRSAAGHVDYADKFPLYLAQRAWGVR